MNEADSFPLQEKALTTFGLSMAFEPFGQKLPVDAIVEGGDDGDV